MRYPNAAWIVMLAATWPSLPSAQTPDEPPSVQVTSPAATIDTMAWLQGCWSLTRGDRTVEEHWMTPRGGSMLGTSRTVVAGVLREYELIVLREQDGHLAYQAHPSGQASAVFLSSTLAEGEVIFENLQHDFPQRIGYRRIGADEMLAWIEGPRQGQNRRIDFPYRRAACP